MIIKERKYIRSSFEIDKELYQQLKSWAAEQDIEIGEFFIQTIDKLFNEKIIYDIPKIKRKTQKEPIIRGFFIEEKKYTKFKKWLLKNNLRLKDVLIYQIQITLKQV